MTLDYVLITAAKNEEEYIEKTIQSVISQTILPKKWIIVSDSSTDRTDEITMKYAEQNAWIEFIRAIEHSDRNFARKVHCFNRAYEDVKRIEFDIIGNLDGDVSFDKDYFAYLLDKFEKEPELGVAGTPYVEGGYHSYKDSYVNVRHVHGQIQLFRRACFEDIGGYTPIKGGGIDWVAVTTARMKGWKTYSFQDKVFVHHRTMGTGKSSVLFAKFKHGKKDYFLGGHPVWQLCKGIFQMAKRPYIIGGLFLIVGYVWGFITRVEKPLSSEVIRFHRQEQMTRLRELISKKLIIHR